MQTHTGMGEQVEYIWVFVALEFRKKTEVHKMLERGTMFPGAQVELVGTSSKKQNMLSSLKYICKV